MPPARSLNMTVRQPPDSADGFNQASSVIPVVRSSDAASGTVTWLAVPSNDSAAPNFPAASHVVLAVVPLLPLPEASPTVVPAASLNPYAATRPDPGGGGAFATVTVTAAEVPVLP